MDLALFIEVLLIIVKVVILGTVLLLAPIPLTWIERKIAGHIHVRPGPMRVGFHGILQPIADGIKLMMKEDTMPDGADWWLFKISPLIALVPYFAVFAAVPFGPPITVMGTEITLYASDLNVGILMILAISGISVFGFIFGGWASNSKYSLLGSLRATAQMISYEIAISFAAIGVVMMSNTLSLVEMVDGQAGGLFSWNIFYLPVGPVWFFIFFIAGLAEIARVPFDLTEDESTLGAGYHTEYAGMRFAYYAQAEYVAMILLSVLCVIMFLGGWHSPLPFDTPIPPFVWFMGKTAVFIYVFMWTRFTWPRYRYDQLMTIGWKILIPLSLVMLLITGLMRIFI